MSASTHPHKLTNDLWMARQRLGLEQKHVASLLNHKTTAHVSQYEKGERIPGLRILIQLEIIYGVSLNLLYPELYEQLRTELSQRLIQCSTLATKHRGLTQRLRNKNHFCTYLDLVGKSARSEEESKQLRKHILQLMDPFIRD